jgi:hypothetical protein
VEVVVVVVEVEDDDDDDDEDEDEDEDDINDNDQHGVETVKDEEVLHEEDAETGKIIQKEANDEPPAVPKKGSFLSRIFRPNNKRRASDQPAVVEHNNRDDSIEYDRDVSENPSVDTPPVAPQRQRSGDDMEGVLLENIPVTDAHGGVKPKTSWLPTRRFGKKRKDSEIRDAPRDVTLGGDGDEVKDETVLVENDVETPAAMNELHAEPAHDSITKAARKRPSRDADAEEHERLRFRTVCLCITLATLVIIGASIGTGFVAGMLLLQNRTPSSTAQLPPNSNSSTMRPPPAAVAVSVFTCPIDHALLNFSVTFDNDPADVGIQLKDKGAINARIWDFPPGSFRSSTLYQQTNLYQICLNNAYAYELSITSVKGVGLISTFDSQSVSGKFELAYNYTKFFGYDGDCALAGSNACGAYCSCNFTIVKDGSTGACTTNCSATST